MASCSSLAMRPATSPVSSTELRYSRKFSSLTSASVNKNVTCSRLWPATLYIIFKSSINVATP